MNEVWVARYDGPVHGNDEAHAVALDSWGNVYVAGRVYGGWSEDTPGTGESPTGTGFDYAAVKYSPLGEELWADRYCGPSYADARDEAWDIAVDSDGNVYVTGASTGEGTDWDYATIKYDSDGNRLWVARYDGIVRGRDKGFAVDVDEDGNVYVTGSSRGLGMYADYATVKYSASGEQEWVARYASASGGADRPHDIAVHSDGSVYVTGDADGFIGAHDCTTIKYAPDGSQEWVATYGYWEWGWDGGFDIALDAVGNVYVAGWSDAPGSRTDYLAVKYDAEGNEQWAMRYGSGGLNYAHDMTVDRDGNVYVTGNALWDYTGYDFTTIKYDTDGNEEWVARYGGGGFSYLGDVGYAIALDSIGNVYVTGMNDNSADYDCATVKYSPDGIEQWAAVYEGPMGSESRAVGIAVDSSGDVYVVGRSDGDGTSDDMITIKYSDGTGVDAPVSAPMLALSQPVPNPCSGTVELQLYVAGSAEPISVAAYDVQGRLIRHLHEGPLEPGRHVVTWDGFDAAGSCSASGVYFIRAVAGVSAYTRKVVRVR